MVSGTWVKVVKNTWVMVVKNDKRYKSDERACCKPAGHGLSRESSLYFLLHSTDVLTGLK
jgi:hypothetical protein